MPLPVLVKLEHVPDELAVVVPLAVVTGETELVEHPERRRVPYPDCRPQAGTSRRRSRTDNCHTSFSGIAIPMRLLEQLVRQFWFVHRRSPDYQAAIAKNLTISLPLDNRRHNAMRALGLKDIRENVSVRFQSRGLSPAFSHEMPMPRCVAGGPGSKNQAFCLQIQLQA